MKTAGIIKIVLGCLILLALVTIAVGIFAGRSLWYAHDRADAFVEPAAKGESAAAETDKAPQQTTQDNSGKAEADKAPQQTAQTVAGGTAAVGGARYAAADVRAIDIEWIAGGVEVVTAEGDEVSVSETSDEALTQTQQMRCTLQGGTLKIVYCDDIKNVWKWFSVGDYSIPAKQLTLTLPASLVGKLNELEIDAVTAAVYLNAACAQNNDIETVSGEARAVDLVCRELSISTTSGRILVDGCTADELDVESVSGNAKVTGEFGSVDTQGVSGNADIQLASVPRELEGKSVSGNISVTLPADAEFSARLDTVSGDITSEFAGKMSKDSFICGNGANRFEFESVSGDVRLLAG